MRTSGLIVAVILLALLSPAPGTTGPPAPSGADAGAEAHADARPDARVKAARVKAARATARTVALPERGARHLTAAPRAGDTDRLAAAWQRRHRDPPDLVRAPGTGPPVGDGPLRRYAVEVELVTGVAPEAFAAEVDAILSDPRSWTAGGRYTLQRVDRARVDLRVTLASPDSVDALCWPLDTRGTESCWNEDRAVINAFRWEHGATTYGTDLAGYRAYVVNHEIGHGLGRAHAECPSPGLLAPVMLQQTLRLDGCLPNPWPFPEAGAP